MHAPDDQWLGLTAAALLAYDDLRRAQAWLIDNATDEFIDESGYRKVSGRSRPRPGENSLGL